MKMMNKMLAMLVSVSLCAGCLSTPALAYSGEEEESSIDKVIETTLEELEDPTDAVTVTDKEIGPLTPDGNLTLVDDYHTTYSNGSGQQFITLVSKSGAYFYLIIDRADDGDETVHFLNLVDEADLLALMDEDDAEAYTAEKEAAAKAELEKQQAEKEAKKAAEETAVTTETTKKDSGITKIAASFLGVVALIGLAAGGGYYFYRQRKQKKQAEKEALDPDADYTEDEDDFEVPPEDEPEADDMEDLKDIEPV